MSKEKDWRAELQQVAQHLRNPLRMRMAVAGVALAIMFFAVSEPLHGRMKKQKRELADLENTAKVAQEVVLLRAHLEAVQPGIMAGDSNDAITSHLIDLVRGESVDLMRIDTEAPSRMGPLESVRVSMDVTGSFDSLSRLLQQLESGVYLLRIESVSIKPAERNRRTPSMQLSLLMLKEKS
ncbi:GspMb/PilO family protein [Planctomycetes bacterium K23_9]|uniref:General secretion pathway, M protein n=1 Tax=Stieleria marina TaxID=1930275 RepID=A0A517P1S3_9BACT|nr:hypothetical protein K239x_53440 [Planctomycetes bacterium K23_9]